MLEKLRVLKARYRYAPSSFWLFQVFCGLKTKAIIALKKKLKTRLLHFDCIIFQNNMSGNIVNSHYTTHSLFSCGGILETVSLHFLKLMSYCFLG